MDVDRVIRSLLEEVPTFHTDGKGRDMNMQAARPILEVIARVTSPGSVTLETGAGASTAVFLAAGARHTAISPAAHEPERIRAWCSEHGIATDDYHHLLGTSADLLPAADVGDLDVLFIDGDHAFPAPALDWFYGTRALRAGGVVILDDLHLWPCAMVSDFLREEDGWEEIDRSKRHAAFRAQTSGSELTSRWWGQQGLVRRLSRPSLPSRVRRRLVGGNR